ncbi:MAG: S41 family peptidase [Chloroflexi bacterium]|nr:S41 family peptidase [Chloroflexota bacterium]
MSRKVKIVIISLVTVVSLLLSFGAGCALGTSSTAPVTAGPASANLGLDVVSEAWGIIFQDYVEKDKLDARVLSGGAIKGMVEALNDPYTSYLDAENYQLSSSSLEGKFEGIGAFVGIREGKLMVIAPIPGSPADKAGIKAGDLILEVDGSATANMTVEVAVLHIRGPRGTTVRLLILHQGEPSPNEISIVRQEIQVSSVRSEMKGDIAYININHFSERTDEELIPVLKSINQAAATGIILDLRSNPGGLLNEVVDVASHFLKEGVVVSVVDNQGNQSSLSVKPTDVTTALPIIMLADNFSASGSEVLAGALQDYDRAKLAGIKTYGKGSVNTLHQLKDGSGLYITIARWLTPKGRLIEGKGISPDYELKLTGDDAIQWAIDYLKGKKG